MPDSYRRLVFRVGGDAELFSAALWEHGTLGLELVGNDRVVAYFADAASYADVAWSEWGGRLETDAPCESSDWMAAYRAASRPLAIGRRLVVDPREPELSSDEADNWPDRRLLRLPARTAFGTGSHASTRLILELMEECDIEGKRVLDVGFGSGILSFAALAFGARSVTGVEIDLEPVLVAEQNRRLNGLFPSWIAGGVSALGDRGSFDLVLVNVLPERIAGDLDRIRRLMASSARAIFSGIPTTWERRVAGRLERAGFRPIERSTLEEWTALVVEGQE